MTDTPVEDWPVICPFANDGQCPTTPPCPNPRERICITGLDDE